MPSSQAARRGAGTRVNGRLGVTDGGARTDAITQNRQQEWTELVHLPSRGVANGRGAHCWSGEGCDRRLSL